MERNNQPGGKDAAVPGPRAELQISTKQWGTARARVPADQAHHLITTFGILGSVATGTGGAILTLRAAGGGAAPAYAELALALIAAVLIALCSRAEATGTGEREEPDSPLQPRLP